MESSSAPSHPDWIEVLETQTKELAADRADMHVIIKGSSLVTGVPVLIKFRLTGLTSDL